MAFTGIGVTDDEKKAKDVDLCIARYCWKFCGGFIV